MLSQPTHRSSPRPELCQLIQPSSLGRAAFSPPSHKTGPKPSVGSNSSTTSWSKDRTFQWLSAASKWAKENNNILLSPRYPSPTSEVTDLLCTFQKLTGLHGTQKASAARTRAEGLGLKRTDILQRQFPEEASVLLIGWPICYRFSAFPSDDEFST